MKKEITGPKATLKIKSRVPPAPAVVKAQIAKNRTEIIGSAVGLRRALKGKTVPPEQQHLIAKNLSKHKVAAQKRVNSAVSCKKPK